MSHTVLVMGESGSGKSSALRHLNPKETFIINVMSKPLPFKGFNKLYKKLTKESPGNYYATDDYETIKKLVSYVNTHPEFKTLIIDDFQYLMCNEFMRKALERGYDKFTEIAQHAHELITLLSRTRDDLTCFVLSHTDINEHGKIKAKTIGKMLDNMIVLEGMFTIVLHSLVMDEQYKFLTQNDGVHIAKSPMDMFSDKYIDNDLLLVKEKIKEYLDDPFESPEQEDDAA